MCEILYFKRRQTKRRIAGAAGLTALAILASGCAGRGNIPYNPVDFAAPDVDTINVPQSMQRVGPLDKLKITVFQVEDLTGEYRVDAAGQIAFPLLGNVQAQGKTPRELGDHISQLLGARYLRSPNVQVAIQEVVEQTITVDGSVREPGTKPIRGTITLMQAVAMGKGFEADANPGRVIVFRTINGQRMAAGFDLRAIRRAEAEDPLIYGNDIVVVDGSRARQLWGQVLTTLPLLALFRPF
jgi:polysaccharide biosynthesis/export protein